MPRKLLTLLLAALLAAPSPMLTSRASAAPLPDTTLYALLDEQNQAVIPYVSAFCWAGEDGLYFLGDGIGSLLFHWRYGQQDVDLVCETPLDWLENWRPARYPSSYDADYAADRKAVVFSLEDGLYALMPHTGHGQALYPPAGRMGEGWLPPDAG